MLTKQHPKVAEYIAEGMTEDDAKALVGIELASKVDQKAVNAAVNIQLALQRVPVTERSVAWHLKRSLDLTRLVRGLSAASYNEYRRRIS